MLSRVMVASLEAQIKGFLSRTLPRSIERFMSGFACSRCRDLGQLLDPALRCAGESSQIRTDCDQPISRYGSLSRARRGIRRNSQGHVHCSCSGFNLPHSVLPPVIIEFPRHTHVHRQVQGADERCVQFADKSRERQFQLRALELSDQQSLLVAAANVVVKRFGTVSCRRLGQAKTTRSFGRILASLAKGGRLSCCLYLWNLNARGSGFKQPVYQTSFKIRDANDYRQITGTARENHVAGL